MAFAIRPSTRADYEAIVALTNSQINEPITVEDLEREERLRSPEYPFCRLVAVDEAGSLRGFVITNCGPSSRPGQFWLRVRVWKEHQGRGIGRALYATAEAFVREHGGTSIESGVRDNEPDALGWVERRGYRIKYQLFESTLSLPDWDPTPFLGALEQAEATGFRLTTLAEEGDVEALLPRYYDFSVELVHDIPGMEDRPRYPYDEWLKYLKEDPHWDPSLIVLVAEGDRWVGMAQISEQNSGGYYNNFTGIHRDYRGKGLSRAVKVAALLKAKELGAPYLRTNNHSVNQPMLATNEHLGYKPQPGFLQITKSL